MESIVANYNPIVCRYTNGSVTDHILNMYPIFIINLNDNIERRQYIAWLMRSMKLNYTLVMVDKLDHTVYDVIDKTAINIDKNKLGCAVSHLFCLKRCIDAKYPKFLILEDDVLFHKRFNELCTGELLNTPFDMLMLGACDFNVSLNHTSVRNTYETGLKLYNPIKQAVGAHANMYSHSFAVALYTFKMKLPVFEFDADFRRFYKSHKIYICMPNLVVCELSTTNLNHVYGYNSAEHAKYIKRIFLPEFTYTDYRYITIHFIQFVKRIRSANKRLTMRECVDAYVKECPIDDVTKQTLSDNLLSSGYTLDDVMGMYS